MLFRQILKKQFIDVAEYNRGSNPSRNEPRPCNPTRSRRVLPLRLQAPSCLQEISVAQRDRLSRGCFPSSGTGFLFFEELANPGRASFGAGQFRDSRCVFSFRMKSRDVCPEHDMRLRIAAIGSCLFEKKFFGGAFVVLGSRRHGNSLKEG